MQSVLAAHTMAQTAFSVRSKEGKARCGTLVTKKGSIETPAVLLYTRRGGPLSLTSPDMLAAVTPPIQAVQISAMQFLENPDANILREQGQGASGFLCLSNYPVLASNRDPTMFEYGARPSTDKEVHVSIHSGGHMVNPDRYMETVAALQPDMYVTLCDEVSADVKPKRATNSGKRTVSWLDACLRLHLHYRDHSHPPSQPATAEAAAAGGVAGGQQQGRRQGQPAMASARHQGAESGAVGVTAKAGEAPRQPEVGFPGGAVAGAGAAMQVVADGGSVGGVEGGSNGTARGAVEEGEAAAAGGGGGGGGGDGSAGGSGRGPLAGAIPLAALAGGAVVAERTRAAAAVVDKEGVGGYALCGLGTGEPPELRPALIAASLGALPAETLARRPVFASGLVGSPDELLEAVAEGVDLLDCAYVAQVTAGGHALTFPLRPPPPPADTSSDGAPAPAPAPAPPGGLGPDVSVGADDTKINLWSTSYRLDKGPLLPGCGCFACRRHSRAYVHHLLNTHEMLADVLLEAHNTSHMMAFCEAIREAISEGRFDAYRSWFRSLRDVPLVPAPTRVTTKRRATEAADGEALAAGGEGAAGEAKEGGEGGRAAGRAKWVRV